MISDGDHGKINVIGSTKLKLWPFKDPLHFESTRVGFVTRVLVVQIQQFFDFLKA